MSHPKRASYLGSSRDAVADLANLPTGQPMLFAANSRPAVLYAEPLWVTDQRTTVEESLARYDPWATHRPAEPSLNDTWDEEPPTAVEAGSSQGESYRPTRTSRRDAVALAVGTPQDQLQVRRSGTGMVPPIVGPRDATDRREPMCAHGSRPHRQGPGRGRALVGLQLPPHARRPTRRPNGRPFTGFSRDGHERTPRTAARTFTESC